MIPPFKIIPMFLYTRGKIGEKEIAQTCINFCFFKPSKPKPHLPQALLKVHVEKLLANTYHSEYMNFQ